MTRVLRNLTGNQEPAFTKTIRSLEGLTGNKSIDIELTAEVIGKLSEKIQHLGLDPTDTTPQELHEAAKYEFLNLDRFLREHFNHDFSKVINLVNKSSFLVPIPSINKSLLRKAILEQPPKKTMKQLGCRTVASMIKRFSIEQILLGCMLHEQINWHRNFAKIFKKFKTTDITMSKPKIVLVDQKLTEKYPLGQSLPYVQLAGIVGVNQANLAKPGGWAVALTLLSKDLHYIHQRGIYSKLLRFSKDISNFLVRLTYTKLPNLFKLSDLDISWSALYLYISKMIKHINFNDSIVDGSDFKWHRPSELLEKICDQIGFWHSSEILGKYNDFRPVSININDIAYDVINNVSYESSTNSSLKRHLNEELISRYLQQWPETDAYIQKLGITT